MNLSEKALRDLRVVLRDQMTERHYNQLTDEHIRHIGELVMTVMVSSLKVKRSLFNRDRSV